MDPLSARVEIDELVVEAPLGVDPSAFERDLRAELGRLVAERGLPRGLAARAGASQRDLPELELPPVQRGALGAQVARALFEELDR